MGAAAWMADVRVRVDERLHSYFARKREESAGISPEAGELVDAIATLTMRGGKRLRPAVIVAAFRAVAPAADVSATVDASAAVELLQSYLLIHDDWMDQDDERRGGPSVHAALAEAHQNAHLGASLAVLAGDLASTYAWELLAASPFPAGREKDGFAIFLRMQQEVFFGQHLDLVGSRDVELMQQLKTGSYTVRGPLRLGAVLGAGTPSQMAALEKYGTPLGLAFQLRDDLLGTFGDAKELGKPTGADLRAGKRNSLVADAEKTLGERERAPLTRVLGNAGADDADVARAAELLVVCGARQRVEERLRDLLAEAKDALALAPLHSEGTTLLREVADLLAIRDR